MCMVSLYQVLAFHASCKELCVGIFSFKRISLYLLPIEAFFFFWSVYVIQISIFLDCLFESKQINLMIKYMMITFSVINLAHSTVTYNGNIWI